MAPKPRSLAPWRLAPAFAVLLAWGTPSAELDSRLLWAANGQLKLIVVDDDTGRPIPCRMHLVNAAGRPRRVKGQPFWRDHFVFPGKIDLKLPVGSYRFELTVENSAAADKRSSGCRRAKTRPKPRIDNKNPSDSKNRQSAQPTTVGNTACP